MLKCSPRAQAIVAGLASLAMIAAVGAFGVAARSYLRSDAAASAYVHHPRVCFPRRDWSAGNVPDAYRPCARIVDVYEDGSVRVQVSDKRGTVRWSAGIGARDR